MTSKGHQSLRLRILALLTRIVITVPLVLLLFNSPLFTGSTQHPRWMDEFVSLRYLAESLIIFHHDHGAFPDDDPSGSRWYEHTHWDRSFELVVTRWDPLGPYQDPGKFAILQDGTVVLLARWGTPQQHFGAVNYFPPGTTGTPARLVWTGDNQIDEGGAGDDVTIELIPGQRPTLSFGPGLYTKARTSAARIPSLVIAFVCIACVGILIVTRQPWWRIFCLSVAAISLAILMVAWLFSSNPHRLWFPGANIFRLAFLGAMAVELLMTIVLLVMTRSLHPAHCCDACGYDLRGLAVPICPECAAETQRESGSTFKC